MASERIFVALSGGVDSAVSAALLVEQGHAVEGVYMKYASENVRGFVDPSSCSWQDDLAAVESVGRHLGIPVRSINVEREYDQRVISLFLSEYANGRTPNPDVACNRDIKFGLFFNWALRHGADAIATGHYARRVMVDGRWSLATGRDLNKDQSYFLYTLDHSILERTRFPIGAMEKTAVRDYAQRIKLPNATRPDSQGVCFIGNLQVRDFLRSRLPNQSGKVILNDGAVIGRHDGLSVFTVGQRHGLGIGGGTPYFVIRLDVERNQLVVGPLNDPARYSFGLIAKETSLHVQLDRVFRCAVRIRYRQPLVPATVVQGQDQTLTISFDQPQPAVAPGQAVVLYDGDRVLGGATIQQPITTHIDALQAT